MDMKKIFILALAFILSVIFLSGCASLILPYEEEPLCRLGVEGGYCGSLSDVYDAVSYEMYPKKREGNRNTKGEYLK